MATLAGKTLFITGASRGIGAAIAVRAARDGANIAIVAKTDRPHPKLPGTIHTTAQAVEKEGGRALALAVDIRDAEAVATAVERTADSFGGIDILVNNASAIWLAGAAETPLKRFDLMLDVNLRGSFICSQACLPFLRKADNPHILNLAPPPNLDPRWFRDHVAYTISKYGMSLCALGMAEEFRDDGIAVNTLWPRTVIATAALAMLGGLVKPEQCRKPEIVADAAQAILVRPARECTGRHFIDDEALAEAGITNLDDYAVAPGTPLATDLFLD
ncbi:MAG: SDR family oxidoreductase [Gammaproteobacteria bacterium]